MPGTMHEGGGEELAAHVSEGARFVAGKTADIAKAVANSVIDDAKVLADAKASPLARVMAAADLAADAASIVTGPEDIVAERVAVKGIEEALQHAPAELKAASITAENLKRFFVENNTWHREHAPGFIETHHRFCRGEYSSLLTILIEPARQAKSSFKSSGFQRRPKN